MLGLQTVEFDAKPQVSVQQSSFEGSQTEFGVNLQVVGLQHGLSLHPVSPPQSQSSPASTIPLPHWEPVMRVTPLLSVRQFVRTALRPMAEQMLPMEQGENFVIPVPVEGFMTNPPPDGQDVVERGQHCWALDAPLLQVEVSQSWTAPNV